MGSMNLVVCFVMIFAKKTKISPIQLPFAFFTPDFIWSYQYLAPLELVPD
jgi:hypothetical protein